MPKDADFNCGVNDGPVSVETYASVTRGAHGAVDFWGNVWEWTDTVRASSEEGDSLAVKGGSWKSPRTDCRTEYRGEERNEAGVYDEAVETFRHVLEIPCNTPSSGRGARPEGEPFHIGGAAGQGF